MPTGPELIERINMGADETLARSWGPALSVKARALSS
jgi:hypothetical protein